MLGLHQARGAAGTRPGFAEVYDGLAVAVEDPLSQAHRALALHQARALPVLREAAEAAIELQDSAVAVLGVAQPDRALRHVHLRPREPEDLRAAPSRL